MKIYSWNVNGIRAVLRKNLFTPFLEDCQPDIVCLQEIKAQQKQVKLDIPQYEEVWNPAEKPGYSGTAVFSREKPLSATTGFAGDLPGKYNMSDDPFGDPLSEGRLITAEYERFFLVNVYTPNAKDDLGRLELRHKRWDPAFLEHCKILEETKPVIFCGDLNVAHTEDDLANPAANKGKHGFTDEEREGFGNFLDAGFVDTFRIFTTGKGHYSWWSYFANSRARNVGWRIDYFLVSQSLKDKVKSAGIHADIMGSDHCPVSIELDL